MAKTYQKKNTKKTKIILSPHNAEKIIEAEFIDSKGGKHSRYEQTENVESRYGLGLGNADCFQPR